MDRRVFLKTGIGVSASSVLASLPALKRAMTFRYKMTAREIVA